MKGIFVFPICDTGLKILSNGHVYKKNVLEFTRTFITYSKAFISNHQLSIKQVPPLANLHVRSLSVLN